MANTVLDYLKDNLHNNTSLRVDLFYGDGTQDSLQWMIHFEKVTCSNAWDEVKKIYKYAIYLEDDAKEWYEEIDANTMADWATWKAGLFKCLVKCVEIQVDQCKRLFIKGLLPYIAPLVTMQIPATLAAALELAQAYKEGLDMVNEIELRKQKGKKKVVESSNKDEEKKKKPKKTVLKKKKEAKVTFDPAYNLDELTKKFEKMQLNLIQKMENNQETCTCFKCGKEEHISWDCPDRKDNSDNFAHAKLVEVEEESEKEEDKLLQHLLDAYNAYLEK
ncbi:hypothetical protein Glove_132g181 [Diversispora epigaea]|uniref:CCHC-type domain-containing protein n=1 Tax=Diversispora epigaea TaxID=1348612 RepID=A0A397J082_9GLOM|nr:hypothetical protein Glove_132g181 [Diversispora epigaea]